MIAGLPPAIHRHCETCKIRTFCGAIWCGEDRRHWGPQEPELTINPTVPVDLNELKGFREKLRFAFARCYGHSGDSQIDIPLKIVDGVLKWAIVVTLTDKDKLNGDPVDLIRENGEFRLEKPAEQERLFK